MSNKIEDTIHEFLADWNRAEWMIEHGEWASAEWDAAREEYDAALAELRDRVGAADDADRVGHWRDADAIVDCARDLARCARALDGQVTPDESDYIVEGTIDPDGVSDTATLVHDDPGTQGWDCLEKIQGYRHGDALYMRWMRQAYGNRHARDLWVAVSDRFFAV